PTNQIGAPRETYGYSVVWTGREMIVWGGQDDHGLFVATGARYNPAVDQWFPTSTTSAPAARYRHGAVWVGNRMLIWSGQNFDDEYDLELESGGLYDPATDTWSATTDFGPGRALPVAVWTGTKALFWGGVYSPY